MQSKRGYNCAQWGDAKEDVKEHGATLRSADICSDGDGSAGSPNAWERSRVRDPPFACPRDDVVVVNDIDGRVTKSAGISPLHLGDGEGVLISEPVDTKSGSGSDCAGRDPSQAYPRHGDSEGVLVEPPRSNTATP